jgi:predicted DCC family thiol-disulfide oxidoreductase YuxK
LGLFQLPGVVRAKEFSWVPDLPPDFFVAFIALWVLSSFCFSLGLFTRASGTVLLGCITYTLLLDQSFGSHHVYYLSLLVFLLTIGRAGAVFSLDWLRAGRPNRTILRWPVVLLKIQVSLVYFFTAVSKINVEFISGSVLQRSIRLPGFPLEPTFLSLLALATIGLEFFLAFGLWWRRTQDWAFLFGTVLHFLILVLLGFRPGLIAFSVISVAPYILFLRYQSGSRLVFWDDDCALSRACTGLLRKLDWLAVHRFRNEAAPWAASGSEAASSLGPCGLLLVADSRRFSGFAALAEVLALQPAGFLLAPALRTAPARWLGERAYRGMALRASRTAGGSSSPSSGP